MDRVMVSFYIAQSAQKGVEKLAAELGLSKADAYRRLIDFALERMPREG